MDLNDVTAASVESIRFAVDKTLVRFPCKVARNDLQFFRYLAALNVG